MLLYLVIGSAICLLSIIYINSNYLKSGNSKILFSLIIIFLILFAGFRYGIETDYWNYYKIFTGKMGGIDAGYSFVINLFKKYVSTDFNLFILCSALFSILPKVFFFMKLEKPFFGLFLYFSFFYIMLEWNAIRQGLAIAFLLMGVIALQKNKKVFFFILVLAASTIHASSIIFILFYFIRNINFKIKNIYKLIVIVYIIKLLLYTHLLNFITFNVSYFLNSPLQVTISHLLGYLKDNNNVILTIGLIRRLALIILYLCIKRTIPDEKKYSNSKSIIYKNFNSVENKQIIKDYYFNGYLTGVLIYILFMGNEVMANRCSLMFDILMIPMFSNLNFKCKINNFYFIALIYLLSIAIYIYTLINGTAVPYQSYLFYS